MRVAVVTLVIGHTYLDRWKFQCEPGWRAYCQRHGYDLVVIDHALDTSARAQSRSPAWQKCLILDGLTQYDRVVWIDADIVINPHSRLHFAGRREMMNLLISLNRNAPCPCASGKRYKHCHGRYA
jgi:hypothetical protein